jgi:hypothetical protein
MIHARLALLLAGTAALAACDGADVEINGQKGVPLSELEIAGEAPPKVFLASGDNVIVTEGNTFAIKVEGSDTGSLRFVRDKEVIGITRVDGWNGNTKATIRITMPAPKEIIIGGAGTVKARASPARPTSISGAAARWSLPSSPARRSASISAAMARCEAAARRRN